jgi:hypothetical protein
MRRLLASTMTLGLVITAMGFTGIFAEFTDRTTTGTNTEESGEQSRTADLQIAIDDFGDCSAATFTENLETGLFDVTGLVPGATSFQSKYICLRNAGTAALALTVSAMDVVETETGCTGDEQAAGDATCGTAGIGDGELGSVLILDIQRYDCVGGTTVAVVRTTVADLDATPGEMGTIEAGGDACLHVQTYIPNPGVSEDFTSEALQQAQSDKIQWRIAFDGTAP